MAWLGREVQAQRARGRMRIRGGILTLSVLGRERSIGPQRYSTYMRCGRVTMERPSCVSKYFHALQVRSWPVHQTSRWRRSAVLYYPGSGLTIYCALNLWTNKKPLRIATIHLLKAFSQPCGHGNSYVESLAATANSKNANSRLPEY